MNEPSPHLLPEPNRGAREAGASVFVSAQDGLRLHVREYGTRGAPGLAVVCLPGITRTVADFDGTGAGAGGRSDPAARHRH